MKLHRMNRLNYFGLICLALFSLPSLAQPLRLRLLLPSSPKMVMKSAFASSRPSAKAIQRTKSSNHFQRFACFAFKKFKQGHAQEGFKEFRTSLWYFPSGKGDPQLLSIQAHGKQPSGKLAHPAIDNRFQNAGGIARRRHHFAAGPGQ